MHGAFKKLLSKSGGKASLSTKVNKPSSTNQSKGGKKPRKIKLHNDCGCE